jgi:pyruvate dehydrogenase E1 component
MVSIMTALYFSALRPEDRVAVKPHASPVFHAMQYLMGNLTREKMENFRGFGGAQSYPSRTKDATMWISPPARSASGSPSPASPRSSRTTSRPRAGAGIKPLGRMIALAGDAELDEGNIYEALAGRLEERPAQLLVDHRLQQAVARRHRARGAVATGEKIFEAFGWDVVRVKYGALQRAAFEEPGGKRCATGSMPARTSSIRR